ncbi:alpha-glucuronidase A [Apiospora saccharicola]|uniref:Alpha-galactosidase n=1 Tax=Apiospora saccharicola TaxID=335842 RepID=A0ABR1TKJ7_9PEZI
MYSSILLALPALALAAPAVEKRLDNGLGKTPALGWNSWNVGGCQFANADTALKTAKLFVSLGLKDVGYQYVNIDDCWSTMNRNSSGYLVPDPNKFPKGMKALADEIHSMGLKFGLYGCAGTKTCAGYPGSWGHEVQDAKALASWSVDYWKHDACYMPCNNGQSPQTCWDPNVNPRPRYETFRDALANSGGKIFYSMCEWGRNSVWTWGASVGNSWRMSGDIANNWNSVASIAATAGGIAQYAGPGGFNDLDMMEVGNGALNENEERAHMGLWAIAKSPIILGTDLSKIKTSSLNILKNKVSHPRHQPRPPRQSRRLLPPLGRRRPQNGKLYPYWAGPLSDGVVVGVVAADGAATLSFKFADVPGLGGSGSYSWTELWTGEKGSGTSITTSLGAHDMRVYKVTK